MLIISVPERKKFVRAARQAFSAHLSRNQRSVHYNAMPLGEGIQMPAPAEVIRLLERFDAQREAYASDQYKETEIRVEFIDPFFKALGWDVHNE
jgi:hypothetical protein